MSIPLLGSRYEAIEIEAQVTPGDNAQDLSTTAQSKRVMLLSSEGCPTKFQRYVHRGGRNSPCSGQKVGQGGKRETSIVVGSRNISLRGIGKTIQVTETTLVSHGLNVYQIGKAMQGVVHCQSEMPGIKILTYEEREIIKQLQERCTTLLYPSTRISSGKAFGDEDGQFWAPGTSVMVPLLLWLLER